MSSVPVIAITLGTASSDWRVDDDRGRFLPYAEAVRAAGGSPVMVGTEYVPAVRADAAAFLRPFDGILFSGGVDIHPASYPIPPEFPACDRNDLLEEYHMRVDKVRDELEFTLAAAVFAHGLPALGICRGFQLLNVALGGRLILDIDAALGHSAHPDGSSAHHPVRLQPDSRLSAAYPPEGALRVNSRHHQGVDLQKLAPPLRPTAATLDGEIIEGIEAPDYPWLVGVQWHPERAADTECHRRSQALFRQFVAACRDGKHG